MGIRSRLKKGLKGLINPPQDIQRSEPKPPPPPPPTRPVDASPSESTSASNPSPTAASTPQPKTPTPPKPSVDSSAASLSDDKVARHRERTRKGLLKKTLEAGGTIGLGELHDHSERRFFVGHKAFSDMMEDLVREDLLHFDWDAQEATLTDVGRQYLEAE